MAAEREGELELRADAVGPGDQDRLAVALADFDQRAEAADAGQHLRAHRAPGVGFDPLDERVAGVDVHARVPVGQAGSRGRRVGGGWDGGIGGGSAAGACGLEEFLLGEVPLFF